MTNTRKKGRPKIQNDDRGVLHIRVDRELQTEYLVEAAKKRMKLNKYIPHIIRKGMEAERNENNAS